MRGLVSPAVSMLPFMERPGWGLGMNPHHRWLNIGHTRELTRRAKNDLAMRNQKYAISQTFRTLFRVGLIDYFAEITN